MDVYINMKKKKCLFVSIEYASKPLEFYIIPDEHMLFLMRENKGNRMKIWNVEFSQQIGKS